MFEHELSPKTSHFRSSQYELHCLGTAPRRAHSHRGGRTLELLEEEVRICLGLLGVTSYAQLTPRHVTCAMPVAEAGALSAFPLLDEFPGPSLP